MAGSPGFGFVRGGLLAPCDQRQLRVGERSGAAGPTLSGGELLLPGEVVLTAGASYTMPWVVVVASRDGLDPIAHALHGGSGRCPLIRRFSRSR